MTTWALIFYMSMGFGGGSTGGPSVVDGFTSPEACAAAQNQVKTMKYYDWSICVPLKK